MADKPSSLDPFENPDVPHMWYDGIGRPVISTPIDVEHVIHTNLEPLDPDHPEGPFRVVE